MSAFVDMAPVRSRLPDPGLGRGWETTALMGITLLLLAFGLVTLYSASAFLAHQEGSPDYVFAVRQAQGAAVGLVAMVVLARLPYHVWQWAAWPLVWVSLAALLMLVVPGLDGRAVSVNGAQRWLDVGIRVQPSEFAKVAIIVWTAMMAVRKQGQFGRLSRGLLPFMLVWGALLIPVALQPDLSTAFLMGVLGMLTVFAAGARLGHFVFLGSLLAPIFWLQLQVEYRRLRIIEYLAQLGDPLAASSAGAGYQGYQALVALGSGGFYGTGFGEGRQKFGFLPEPHNDFIFSMIGEEWGFIGVSLLVVGYLFLILVGYRVARRAPDLFGQLLALGCTNLVALQAFLHVGVGVGLLPTTGLALPLVSWGRSNLVVTLAVIGILMSVARETDLDWRPGVRKAGRAADLARLDRARTGGGRA
ncbi:MAG TPA: putative peptidoglycan glycosyltransferase FtsW [Longimicrobiales bacterium]|nr:putative peptidoglycan glycosyltransferase FtsW [Longimicrobiales bacterium]